MLTPRAPGEVISKIKKHLNKLIENNKKGLTFNLGEIPGSERGSLIKEAIKENVDWDIENNIGLISEKEIVEVVQLLINAEKLIYVKETASKIGKNLDKISETKIVEVVEILIKAERGLVVAKNLDKIPKTKIVEVVEILIKAGKGLFVAYNLDKIPEEHRVEIAELIIKAGKGAHVAENLEKIQKEHRLKIAKLIIKSGEIHSADVANNLEKIPEEHRFEVAKLIIKAERGFFVAKKLDKIPKTKIIEVVELLINAGEGRAVADNLEKIPEEHRFEVAKLLIKAGEVRILSYNLDKIPEEHRFEIAELIIEAKGGEYVARNLDKIPKTKIIKVVELLIKAGEGWLIAKILYEIPEEFIVEIVELLIKAGEGCLVIEKIHLISKTKIVEVINLLTEKGEEYKSLLAYFVKYKNEIKKENIIKINEYIKQNCPFNNLEEMKFYIEQKVKDFWNSKMFDLTDERNSLVSEMIAEYIPEMNRIDVEDKLEEYNKTNIEKPFDTRYAEKEIEVSLAKIELKGISDDIKKNINTLKSIVNNIDLNKPEQFSEIYNQIKNKLENTAIDERDIKTIKLKDEVLEIIDNHKKNIPELLSKINFLSQKKNLDISNDLRKIIILYSLEKKHNRFLSLKSYLNNDITIESLKEIAEIISEFITDGNLSKYLKRPQKIQIKKLLYCYKFENEINSNNKINLNDKTKIKLHFSKDYLTNFAESIACTCYSHINILKEALNATSIIFYINDKPAGSCILQDTIDKDDNEITIIYGLNPQNSYLTKINCQEFVSNFLEVIKDTCVKRETIPCIVLDGINELATNRDDIWKQLEPLLKNKKIEVKDYDEINYGSLESEGYIYKL